MQKSEKLIKASILSVFVFVELFILLLASYKIIDYFRNLFLSLATVVIALVIFFAVSRYFDVRRNSSKTRSLKFNSCQRFGKFKNILEAFEGGWRYAEKW